MKRIMIFIVLALFVAVTPVLAAETPNLSVAVAFTAQAPVIDGVLNDAAWLTASILGAKAVVDQDNLGTSISSFPRVAYLTYDDKNLYIGMQIPTQDSSKLKTDAASFWDNDEAEVFLYCPDTMTYYKITVIADGKSYEDKGKNQSSAAVSTTATGWSIEMVMPFETLGVTPKAGDTWQIGICGHQVADGDVWITWNPTYGGFENPARFGNITFLPVAN